MGKFRLSVDDGCASDVRIAELTRKYKVETIFYWPLNWGEMALIKGYAPLTLTEMVVISKFFEIGSHTITHRHLTSLKPEDAMREIHDSKQILESIFTKPVTKFCPPRGYTNRHLTDFTLQYYDEQRLTKGEGLVHIHPNSGANNNMHWIDYAATIDVKELWCHSWELDKYDEWDNLEAYLKEHA